jgi:hypothetical protein
MRNEVVNRAVNWRNHCDPIWYHLIGQIISGSCINCIITTKLQNPKKSHSNLLYLRLNLGKRKVPKESENSNGCDNLGALNQIRSVITAGLSDLCHFSSLSTIGVTLLYPY